MEDAKVMDQKTMAKWLKVVLYIGIFSLLNSVLSMFAFVPGTFTKGVSRGITLLMALAMLQLAAANNRYEKAGILRIVMLVLVIVTEVFHTGILLTLVGSILSIIAVYQEYHAHSELIQEKDLKLSGKWSSLFLWGILAALIVSFASTVSVLLISIAQMDVATATPIAAVVLCIPQWVIDVVYILYLKKMTDILAAEAA